MARRVFTGLFIMLIGVLTAGARVQPTDTRSPLQRTAMRSLPVLFEADADGTAVVARARGYDMRVHAGGATLRLRNDGRRGPIGLSFDGGRGTPRAGRPLATRINDLRGPRAAWRTGAQAYGAARIDGVYDGIDAEFYGTERDIEYDLIVAPGKDVGQIRLRFDGVDDVSLEGGDLRLRAGAQTLTHAAPVAFQRIAGRRTPVAAHYALAADGTVGFVVGAYDTTAPLVIDPVISYSTYFGATGVDAILAVTTDADGNAYLAGRGERADFPVAGSGWKTDNHAFVAKLRADGTPEWITFLAGSGGNGAEQASALAIGPDGDLYATGTGCGDEFPTTPGAYRTVGVRFTCDAFVARFASDGTLKYSTLLGAPSASGPVGGSGIVVDSQGRAAVTGATASPAFTPTMTSTFGPARPGPGQPDVFVARVNASGAGLDWSRLLAGSAYDRSSAITQDQFGNYYVVGSTNSTDYPVRTTIKPQKLEPADPAGVSGFDGFLTQVWEDGQMGLSTYLGGSGEDHMRTVAVGQFDRVYVGGSTNSPEWAPFNHDPARSNGVLYLIGSTRLLAAQPVGGSGYSAVSSLTIGREWTVWVAGETDGAGFQLNSAGDDPLPQPAPAGGNDLFVQMYEANLSSMWYSYVIGGASNEMATSIAVDRQGDIYLAGASTSADYPVTHPLQSTLKNAPSSDGVITKLGCFLNAFLPVDVQPAAGGEGSFFFASAPGCLVNAVSDSSWLHVTGADDKKVYFTTDPNPSSAERHATITLSSKKVAPVSQAAGTGTSPSGTDEIVLNAGDMSASFGNWQAVPDEVHGTILTLPDRGAPKIETASAHPSNWVEFTFTADAGKPYHLWIHGRAQNDDWRNDSVFVQFSDSVDASGNPIYRRLTTSAAWVSLEECTGCGEHGWGWQDNAYGARGDLGPAIYFATSGTHTLLLQQREDGFSIGQIVLSSRAYLRTAPGGAIDDPTIVTGGGSTPPPPPRRDEIVLWTAGTGAYGTWQAVADATAAGQAKLWNPDAGAPKLEAPLAAPVNYVDITFDADAGKPYHLWLRMKADNNHWTNDSAWIQFSGSVDASGRAISRIGTAEGTWVSLEECSGCGEQGWGWQDNAYGAPGNLGAPIYFAVSGPQTIRMQVREDGLAVDQIVLSASKYLAASPGANRNDTTIVPRTER